MAFHWQSNVNVKQVGVDDMVLLSRLSEDSITDNLKKRFNANSIFTYIGPVLISVNPFKQMPYFTEKEMELYQGATQYENPPHIYALADNMFRNMLIERESQCVIISGESGAGKTVAAKYIMNYISRISGGGSAVQHVKDVILQSNPLLEAFGNSATIRNWNSSRFGKYVEIVFSMGGQPIGGKLSNFLLEKSRVVSQNKGDRNFHIFYQLLAGAEQNLRTNLGVGQLSYYNYLNQSGVTQAEDTDDAKEFHNTLHAMQVVGIDDEGQLDILRLVSAVLHIGNIMFREDGNYAAIETDDFLEFPAFLLGLKSTDIKEKLTTRRMESKWGNQTETINMQMNVEQANYTRDAWVKAIYSRLFDFLVRSVNEAMQVKSKEASLSIGILDIYGFEIFDHNGFEQFCINYVNEKLQQIFIELTLKAEQEEYVKEGIKWQEIEYFNNKIVCELIEEKKPPGIMSLLDDTCAQNHGTSEGVDRQLLSTLSKAVAAHPHFAGGADSFVIRHYAGNVSYNIDGFCDRNRDVLYPDLIQLMQKSTNQFARSLFPDQVQQGKRPTTASTKIRTQANELVASLMKCTPHYVRCIKPNETKGPAIGMKNEFAIRAGYAFRRPFEKFLWRYAILTEQTWPNYRGDPRQGCELFLLEEVRERKYDGFARKIQKAWRRHHAQRHHAKMKEEASDLMYGKKERRRFSLNRNFVGDYIGLEYHPALQVLAGKRERIDFATTVTKYDRRFKTSKLDLILTAKAITLVGREKVAKGPQKGQLVEIVKRQIPLEKIQSIGLSPYQDDFLILQVREDFTSLLETPFKTEFLTTLSKRYKDRTANGTLLLDFKSEHTITLKKTRFGGGHRVVSFQLLAGGSPKAVLTPNGKKLTVSIGAGEPNTTRPRMNRPEGGYQRQSQGRRSTKKAPTRPQQPHMGLSSHSQPQQNNYGVAEYEAEPRRLGGSAPPITPSHGNGISGAAMGGIATPLAGLNLNGQQTNVVRPAPRPNKPKPPVKPKLHPVVTALYAYDAQDTDELSFEVGAEIELLKKHESGWWQGKIGSQQGLFPSNYVQE
ncbi:unnamed protein product, partial [Mesorhabditis spiculigera]